MRSSAALHRHRWTRPAPWRNSVLPARSAQGNRKVATGLPPSRRPARDNHGIGHRAPASSWPTRRSCSPLLQMQQLLAFFHRQLVDRNAGQARTICATCSALTSALCRARFHSSTSFLSSASFCLDALAQLGGLVVLLARGHIVLLTPQLVQFGLQLLHRHRADPWPTASRVRPPGRAGRWPCQAKARSDVAVRQLGGGDDRILGDADLVVRLEGVAQAAQDHHGLRYRRSGTITGWKRRSSAASFSMYF